MRPISEANGYIDLTKGTSADFNKLMKSFTMDITNIFNTANSNDKTIKKNQDIAVQENMFLQKKIKSLEAKISTVEAALQKAQGKSNSYKVYKTFHNAEAITRGRDYKHEPDYGVITMPYQDFQRIALSQYPKEFLYKNIDITVEYKTLDSQGNQVGPIYTLTKSQNPELLNILDKEDSTFWTHEVETDDSVSSIDFDVTITMPIKIIPNLFINSVGIKPHPMYSLTLKDIKYTDANNNTISRLPKYPSTTISGTQVPQELKEIENVKFMFPSIMTNKLNFSLRQPYYIQSGGSRRFVLGFRGIDIENINITSEESSFIMSLKVPGENTSFSSILNPNPIPITEGTDYGDLVSFDLMYDLQSDTTFPFGSEIASDRDTVYVRVKLRRNGETIPALKGIEFNYLTK